MEDTSGFYKYQDNELYYGPNFVYGPTFELLKGVKDTYTYPVDGWYYFDTIEDAKTFFNIPVTTQ
jgi:hypothetical protein